GYDPRCIAEPQMHGGDVKGKGNWQVDVAGPAGEHVTLKWDAGKSQIAISGAPATLAGGGKELDYSFAPMSVSATIEGSPLQLQKGNADADDKYGRIDICGSGACIPKDNCSN